MSRQLKVTSFTLLMTSIIVFIIMSLSLRTQHGDNASSLFKLMLSSKSIDEACLLINPLSKHCSYNIVKPYWLTSILINRSIDLLPYLSGTFVLVLVYIYAWILFKDMLIAGFSTLLLALTPGFLYYFRPGNEGPYLLSIPLLLAFSVASFTLHSKKSFGLVSTLSLVLLALLSHDMAWIAPLSFSLSMLALYVRGYLDKYIEYTGLGIVAISLIIVSLYGLEYLSPPLSASISAIILTLIFNKISKDTSFSYRTMYGLMIGLTTFALALSWHVAWPGTFIPSFKQYDPVFDYGILGILGIAGLIVFTKQRYLGNVWKGLQGPMYTSSLIFSLVFGLLERSLVAYASSLLAVLAGFVCIYLAKSVRAHIDVVLSEKRPRVLLTRFVSILLVIGLFTANIVASLSIPDKDTVIPLSELSEYGNMGKLIFSKETWSTAVSNITRSIMNSANSDNILLVSYWGYSLWLQELLSRRGIKTYALSNVLSDQYARSLVSRIMLSDEMTAANILKNISDEIGVDDVYVLITFAASISTVIRVVGGGIAGDIYIGVPSSYEIVGGYYPQVIFRPAGDHGRLPLYIELAGLNMGDFITQTTSAHDTSIYLAWNTRGQRTLLAQITVNALNYLNYTVYNAQIGYTSLRSDLSLFKPIYVVTIPVYDVSIWYASYEVVYVIAVYKLELAL
ncbi:MAG: hypothetical protein QW254_03550 [Desulfurococcaceae archaeon]